jgi:hypothetical protein
MTVPTGHHAFTSDKVLPGLNWLCNWEINDWLSTAGSTQANLAVDHDSGDGSSVRNHGRSAIR